LTHCRSVEEDCLSSSLDWCITETNSDSDKCNFSINVSNRQTDRHTDGHSCGAEA